MRKVLISLMLAGGFAAASSAPAREQPTDAERFAKITQGLVPGPPQTCLPVRTTSSQGLTAIGPRLIYRISSRLVYVNETRGGCERVARNDILITQSYGQGVCQGDLARTVSRAGPQFTTGSCALGQFIPYRKP